MKTVKTVKDINTHPLVESFIKNYDGHGKHSVILKDGYRFETTESCQDIGTVKELCDSINNYIEEDKNFCG